MKALIFSIFLCLPAMIFAQTNIQDARNSQLGSSITIRGVVTNGDELGTIRYIQDATAGLAAFPGGGSVSGFDDVRIGDQIEVSGELVDYRGLLEINPITSFAILSNNNNLPVPEQLSLSQIGEENESELVKVSSVQFSDAGLNFEGSRPYSITSNGVESQIYLRGNNNLIGTQIPSGSIELTAISSFFNEIQLLPRGLEDLEVDNNAFSFSELPIQSDLSTSSIELSWSTNMDATHSVTYGLDLNMESFEEANSSNSTVKVTLNSLEANSFYYVQTSSTNVTSTIKSPIYLMSTASTSSGEIKVFFNHDVDESFSNGALPTGNSPSQLKAAILEVINDADFSLDFCAYNNDDNQIVGALNEASQRGVQVRYIANDGTSNSALGLANQNFEAIFVNPFSLMHNKFIVADANSIENAKILTGSTNFTTSNLNNDYNNTVVIQDITLAKAYTLEFEEMWGSMNSNPDINSGLAGNNKKNNSPHLFKVNDVLIENYFSPSDNTTNAIINALETAENEIMFALLSFTKDDIAASLLDRSGEGILVRGMMESINDQGSEYSNLSSNGIEIRRHSESYQLHHKYAIVDPYFANEDPLVITGSHNWSNAAENSNDENTLIIHDRKIANIYQQEFEARWAELPTSIDNVNSTKGISISPNPSSHSWQVQIHENAENCIVRITTLSGMIIGEHFPSTSNGQINIDAQNLKAGIYILNYQSSNSIQNYKLIKQ